jgi:uncharacterized membrane protein
MTEFVILRLIHILSAMIWVGSAVFGSLLLMPTLASLGPAAGPVMAGLRARGMAVFMPTVAIVTILSGLRLMWISSGGFSASYFATTWGATYAGSGAAAILAFATGMLVSRPQAARMGALAAQLRDAGDDATRSTLTARLAAARRRSTVLSWVLLALLIGSAAGMAVARYLA